MAAEVWAIVDFGFQHGKASGRTFLTVVPKGRAHKVFDRLIVIGKPSDNQAVLAAGFGKEAHVRLPALKHQRGCPRASQDHPADAIIGDEGLPDLVVGGGHKLQHFTRNAGRPQRLHQMPAHQRRFGGGLEDYGVASDQGG